MIVCPCCGGRGEIEEGAPVPLSELEFRIYDTVRRATGGISGAKLLGKIYDHRIDGGPDQAQKTMHVTIWRMNRKLAAASLRVAATTRGVGGVYKLRRLSA